MQCGVRQGCPPLDPQEGGLPLVAAAGRRYCSVGSRWLFSGARAGRAGAASAERRGKQPVGTERGSSARGEDGVCRQTPCVTLSTLSN